LNLEQQSFKNLVRWYGDDLLYIHEKGRKPDTISSAVAKRLVKKGALTNIKNGVRYYGLTERAIRVLKELKEIGDK